jgi:hypothetical protein
MIDAVNENPTIEEQTAHYRRIPTMWQSIDSAPTNTPVVVLTEGLQSVVAVYMAFDETKLAWQAHVEGNHPACWTDGVCWASNEDNEPSDPPKWWAPMPPEWDQ